MFDEENDTLGERRTFRDILKMTLEVREKKTPLNKFKSVASRIGKQAVQEKTKKTKTVKLNQVQPIHSNNENI